jgi:8-oxo-dGTP pyrophosphatase MutT (NUDIX family)
LLDNLTAGGLPTGEDLEICAVRELFEEAGITPWLALQLKYAGQIRASRPLRDVWHDEILHSFNLCLADYFCPVNQDGEVAEFLCLGPGEVVQKVRDGEFTVDATLSLVQGLTIG